MKNYYECDDIPILFLTYCDIVINGKISESQQIRITKLLQEFIGNIHTNTECTVKCVKTCKPYAS